MDPKQKFEENARAIRRMLGLILLVFVLIGGMLTYLLIDPGLTVFRSGPEAVIIQPAGTEAAGGVAAGGSSVGMAGEDPDKIEDGIHLRTGFVEGKGLMAVVNNCTNCHSAKLVTQNRMSREGWEATIRWMQETQNLWDLGANESVILDYLATHYAPESKGRRQNLANIDWYVLED